MSWIKLATPTKIPDRDYKICYFTISFLNQETGEIKQFEQAIAEKIGTDKILEKLNSQPSAGM